MVVEDWTTFAIVARLMSLYWALAAESVEKSNGGKWLAVSLPQRKAGATSYQRKKEWVKPRPQQDNRNRIVWSRPQKSQDHTLRIALKCCSQAS